MKSPDLLLSVAGFFSLLTVACSDGKTIAPSPDNRIISTASVPNPTETATSLLEAKRLGKLLANLNLSNQNGVILSTNDRASTGNLLFRNSSKNPIILNNEGLSYWINICGIATLPDYSMIINVTDGSRFDSDNTAMDRSFNSSQSAINIAPDRYLRDGSKLLRDRINTIDENVSVSNNNRALLAMNQSLIETICALGGAARLNQNGSTDPGIQTMEDFKARKASEGYLTELLEGRMPLIFSLR